MSFRNSIILSLAGVCGFTSVAMANSCANVIAHGSFDDNRIVESESAIYAAGTFRIAGEDDERKQPMFNLAKVTCEKQIDEENISAECKVIMAIVRADTGKPDSGNANCSLDLEISEYPMKEIRKGVLTGIQESTQCFNTILTVDQNAKRIYISFTTSKHANKYEKIKPGMCSQTPRTQVMMNCTAWPRMRKGLKTPLRYCDFSSVGDK